MSAPITMPFKGECFPAYVVQRITRRPSGNSQGYAQPVCSVVNNDDAHTVPRYDERRLSAGGYHTQTGGAVSTTAVTVVKPSSVVMFTQSKLSLRSHRPSLSEQLKTISHGAETITTQLRSAYLADARASTSIQQRSGSNWAPSSKPSDGKVLEATTVHLSVGRLDCRFPCPVHFSVDHCSYLFQHPFESKEIQMVMFYRDMRSLQINVRERCMRFRVDRVLEQFGDDYRPSNPQHSLRIVFATESEAMKVKRFLGKLKPGYFEVVAALDEHNKNQAH